MKTLRAPGPVICPTCNVPMLLRRSDRYPKHPFFYGCPNYPECRMTHSAHPDGRPMGKPGNAETKQARIQAHVAFDPLWNRCKPHDRALQRKRAYSWLADQLGIAFHDCHIGMFDAAMCRRIIAICRDMNASGVRAWARAGGIS